jgi:hypothetical protein
MKKIICLLVLLALTTGVHADDKKKKKPAASGAAVKAPGGGGALSGLSHGAGPAGGRSNAPRVNSHSAPSLSGRAPSSGHGSKSTLQKTGSSAAAGHSTNPLLRKGGQAGSTQHSSNPLTQSNRQAGAGKANPLTKKSASQPGLNNRNGNPLANKNNVNMARNRGTLAQTGRGFNNRTGARNWQRASHANYRVRPYREVFHNYRPYRHDRGWYSSRYDRVVVVGGGYYYWDGGYWYPAWGYDPAISFYAYDGPIYSYDNLPPDQVTMNVQSALQDEGYYTGEVDGQVGPKTREALAAYQTDHNLEVTSAVDEPTVESLGLTQSS